jgi:hypothetical protein
MEEAKFSPATPRNAHYRSPRADRNTRFVTANVAVGKPLAWRDDRPHPRPGGNAWGISQFQSQGSQQWRCPPFKIGVVLNQPSSPGNPATAGDASGPAPCQLGYCPAKDIGAAGDDERFAPVSLHA